MTELLAATPLRSNFVTAIKGSTICWVCHIQIIFEDYLVWNLLLVPSEGVTKAIEVPFRWKCWGWTL